MKKPTVSKSKPSSEPKPEKGYPLREKKDFVLKHPPTLKPKGKRSK
jgi:hypothetical protein